MRSEGSVESNAKLEQAVKAAVMQVLEPWLPDLRPCILLRSIELIRGLSEDSSGDLQDDLSSDFVYFWGFEL